MDKVVDSRASNRGTSHAVPVISLLICMFIQGRIPLWHIVEISEHIVCLYVCVFI